MAAEDRINIDIFKVVTRAIATSSDPEKMTQQLTQLLVGTLGIKGCTVFVLNPETEELEVMASFGLSMNYLHKGPVLLKKSVDQTSHEDAIVIPDVSASQRLQYPREALEEGIQGIASIHIKLYGKLVGVLRLYHFEPWDISERDIESLLILAENIGLAMMYTRILNALQAIKEVVAEVHPVWMKTR